MKQNVAKKDVNININLYEVEFGDILRLGQTKSQIPYRTQFPKKNILMKLYRPQSSLEPVCIDLDHSNFDLGRFYVVFSMYIGQA